MNLWWHYMCEYKWCSNVGMRPDMQDLWRSICYNDLAQEFPDQNLTQGTQHRKSPYRKLLNTDSYAGQLPMVWLRGLRYKKRAHLGDGNMEGYGNLTYKKILCLQTKNSKHQMPSGPFSCGGTHIFTNNYGCHPENWARTAMLLGFGLTENRYLQIIPLCICIPSW